MLALWFLFGLGILNINVRKERHSRSLVLRGQLLTVSLSLLSGKRICNKGLLSLLLGVLNHLPDQEQPHPARLYSFLSRKK